MEHTENPRRQIELLRAIRQNIFFATQKEMAEILNESMRTNEFNKKPITYNKTRIENIENRRVSITSFDIQTYNDALGLSSGFFHLVSRYQKDKDIGDLIAEVNEFLEILQNTRDTSSSTDYLLIVALSARLASGKIESAALNSEAKEKCRELVRSVSHLARVRSSDESTPNLFE